MGRRYTVDNGDGTFEERIRPAVLLTDDSLSADYEGVVRRDGKMVGIRLGSAEFQFDPDLDALDLAGTIGPFSEVTVQDVRGTVFAQSYFVADSYHGFL